MNKAHILVLAILIAFTQAQKVSYFPAIGCDSYNQNGVCVTCKDRYYMFTLGNLCLPVSPLCKSYSTVNGACTSCIDGFEMKQGVCQPIFTMVPISQQLPANCAAINNVSLLCEQCIAGYTVVNGICVQSISNCDSLAQDGKCLKCATGFSLGSSGLNCVKFMMPVDPNCKIADANGCIQCIDKYFKTNMGGCIKMSPLCTTYNLDGTCAQCQPTFIVDATGKCVLKQSLVTRVTYDPLCNKFQKGVCVRCSVGAYFDANKMCRQVSPLCKQVDSNGICLSCYGGYDLKDNKCVVSVVELDPNCNQFNGIKCVRCSNGARFDANGKCVITDPYCKTWNNGACSGCYSGYILNDKGSCIIDTDFNCADWSNGQCNKCSKGYYLDNNRCKIINPYCAKFDFVNKVCTGCYMGYSLYQGSCSESSKLVELNGFSANCRNYDDYGMCTQCFERYYLDSGRCVQVSAYCKTYNAVRGYCTSCYSGYVLDVYGACVIENY